MTDIERLTPLKVDALRALLSAPLQHQPDIGWENHRAGPFNSHTVKWLAGEHLVRLSGRTATITQKGRGAVCALDHIAA